MAEPPPRPHIPNAGAWNRPAGLNALLIAASIADFLPLIALINLVIL